MVVNQATSTTPKCPICGNLELSPLLRTKDRLIGTLGEYDVLFCGDCKLGITNVEVNDEYFRKSYPETYYTEVLGLDGSPKDRTLQLGTILQVGQIRGRHVLEVGCADGSLLRAMKAEGADVVGIEPNDFVTSMGKAHGLDIRKDLKDLGDSRFDRIILFGTLEHLPDPLEALIRFRRLLNQGGHIIVDAPNIASAEAKLLRGMWFNVQVPLHLFHYTPLAVEKLARRAGFKATPIHIKRRTSAFAKSLVDPRLKGKSRLQELLGQSRLVVKALTLFERLILLLGDPPLMFYALTAAERRASHKQPERHR